MKRKKKKVSKFPKPRGPFRSSWSVPHKDPRDYDRRDFKEETREIVDEGMLED